MSPKALMFVHSSNELYGSDVILLELASRLDRSRYVPFVVMPADLPYDGRLQEALTRAGVASRVANMAVLRRRYLSPLGCAAFLLNLVRGTGLLTRQMRTRGIALVHSNTVAVWCGALASGIARVPHLWHVHEIVERPRFVRRMLARLIAWRGERVVAISEAVADHLARDIPALRDKMVIIPDGVDAARFHPGNDGGPVRKSLGVGADQILFAVVGRIHHWKGQETFLDAAAQVLASVPQARFAIVGDVVPGEESRLEALKARAERLGISRQVIWTGYLDDITSVMAALDGLILPSILPEPFGMVILEAMATARPVVATDHGGPREIVLPGETGFLVPPKEPRELARAMIQLASSAELRRALGARARDRVVERFTLDNLVERFQNVYDEMLEA